MECRKLEPTYIIRYTLSDLGRHFGYLQLMSGLMRIYVYAKYNDYGY